MADEKKKRTEPRKIRQGLGVTPEWVDQHIKNNPKAMELMTPEVKRDRTDDLDEVIEKHQKTLDGLKNMGGRKRKMKNLKSFVKRSHAKSPKAMKKLK